MTEALEDAPKYRAWRSQLKKNGLTINGIDQKYVRHRHNGELLFALLELDALTPEGDRVPPACFLKGQAVAVLVALIDADTGEKFVVLVRQRRIADGSLTHEHPAGMVDADDDPAEVAARELAEEIGLHVRPDELTRLRDRPLFPSSGTSDEAMHFFFVERSLSRPAIMAFQDKDMGVASEHERIKTSVVTLPDAHRLIRDVSGLLLNFLYLHTVGDYETMKLLGNGQ